MCQIFNELPGIGQRLLNTGEKLILANSSDFCRNLRPLSAPLAAFSLPLIVAKPPSLNGELPVAHVLTSCTIDFDGTRSEKDVDVDVRFPISTSKLRIRITKTHMHANLPLILQKI